MNLYKWAVLLPALVMVVITFGGCGADKTISTVSGDIKMELPEPVYDSDTSVEEALLGRRSVRDYSEKAITLEQLSQLLWAGQGITDPSGKRTAPSAGALYPLEVYAVIGNVEGLAPGVYKYEPETHSLTKVVDGDQRKALSQAAVDQAWVEQGAINIVITAVCERTTVKYGERGITYVHLEAGHAAQNICLQVVALKLGAVTIGAFDDEKVKSILNLPDDEVPLYIMPVGNLTD
jgi:SagB-type dehydrogenase family enzyme